MISVGEISNIVSIRIPLHAKQRKLFDAVLSDSPKKWEAIGEIYRLQKIICGNCYEAYPVDWCSIFTPIEYSCWCAIRRLGSLPFNPQYPVGRFFVDFGDPNMRIAIECDGKQWHDAGKDGARDAVLADMGWHVFRVTGRQCNLPEDHPESVDSMVARIGRDFYGRGEFDHE